ncbi:MAG: MerR family transcriptional regulator [Ancylobacter novellus]|uniref:MerR family transcriptional regulator n=1 Tax=Ancylobacter novellus TaxID=921 RepID=A0A2W5KMG6_ANCNO|nr:MAG: MerR family transcriptional regulator [Ancylobacter novellus]
MPRKGPDAFRTISEVAEELGLPQHVLRFWETKFPQIRPIKRGGGRRYYRPADVDLLRGVKQLLYGEGYTIRGVQRILREQGGRKLAQEAGLRPAGDDVRAEPLVGAPAGPEMWASGLRPAVAEPQPLDGGEEYATLPLREEPSQSAQSAPLERRGGLTEEQIGRLSMALDELAACRRLLDGRS